MRSKIFSFVLFFLLAGCEKNELTIFPTKDLLIGKWIEKDKPAGTQIEFTIDDIALLFSPGNPLMYTYNFRLDASNGYLYLSTPADPQAESRYDIKFNKKNNELTIEGLYFTIDFQSQLVLVKK